MTDSSKAQKFHEWVLEFDSEKVEAFVHHKSFNDNVIKNDVDYVRVVPKQAYQQLEKELQEAKAVIQRQAELISYFINTYPQTKDLAKIKAEFLQYTAVNNNTGE